ncbi:MAG: hypothetical protein ACOX0U_10785 [Oscillospiraceae bacterium]|jgi:hypothetical protein
MFVSGMKRAFALAADYDGTTPEEMELSGLTFYITAYTYSGSCQTKYIAATDGKKLEIGIAGADHKNNKELQGMLNSIRFTPQGNSSAPAMGKPLHERDVTRIKGGPLNQGAIIDNGPKSIMLVANATSERSKVGAI